MFLFFYLCGWEALSPVLGELGETCECKAVRGRKGVGGRRTVSIRRECTVAVMDGD